MKAAKRLLRVAWGFNPRNRSPQEDNPEGVVEGIYLIPLFRPFRAIIIIVILTWG
jgi:hypothetical protein